MPTTPENPDFFRDLKSFSDFSEVIEDAHFSPAPSEWCVVIADVKGSTQAIEEGRYKDVNTIGAAAIAVVQNALGEIEVPFVFGGDGATLLVPNSYRNLVAERLAALKRLAQKTFDLELRVGIVDVGEVIANGHIIDLAKLELCSGKCVAIFRGGGLSHAEQLVKGLTGKYRVTDDVTSEVDLRGLSCRWNAIPNQNGCIISLLVAARGKNEKSVYSELFEKIESITATNETNPVNTSAMTYRSVAELARDEKRLHPKASFGWFRRLSEIVAAVLIFKWKVPPLFFSPRRYVDAMRTHSDYRKFDDMLRMVIDCTIEQSEQLGDYLERAHGRGDVFYGIARSGTSLMTCYFQSARDGDHIHFIDGGDGGYAMAAKQLKAQMHSGQ